MTTIEAGWGVVLVWFLGALVVRRVITFPQPIVAMSLYKLDAGSQPERNAHRDHRTGSVRNARQGPANPESSWRTGARLGFPHVCAKALRTSGGKPRMCSGFQAGSKRCKLPRANAGDARLAVASNP